jgi:uncharacterized protein (TIGR01370 family)
MQLTKLMLFVLPAILVGTATAAQKKQESLLVHYGKLNPSTTQGYAYLILEAAHYNKNEIQQFKESNKRVLAYVSLAEVNAHASYYKNIKNYTLEKNENWNSYLLNITNSETKLVIMELITNLIKKGFDGFFFDNFDNYGPYGKQGEQKHGLFSILKNIKERYPNLFIIQNAGLELLNETGKFVDAIAVESVATNYNLKTAQYQLRDSFAFQKYLQKIKCLSQKHNLPVLLIEYANTKALKDSVDSRLKNESFPYFVGHIYLQNIPQFE